MAQSSLVSAVTSQLAPNATQAAIVQTGGAGVLSISTDGAFSGSAITFNVAADPAAVTLQQLRKADGSGAYSIAISANQTLPIPAADFAGYSQVQPVSGTSQITNPSVITLGLRAV